MIAAMTDVLKLPPHLKDFYHAYFKNFNAIIRRGISAAEAVEIAWQQTLASQQLTEAEQATLRALIQ